MLDVLLKNVLLPISRKYVEVMVDEVSERVNEKVDEIAKRSAIVLRELIPPIIYSTLFFGGGVLILVIGASAYIDRLFATEGAGAMLGGCVLILLGTYYKKQMDTAVAKIAPKKE